MSDNLPRRSDRLRSLAGENRKRSFLEIINHLSIDDNIDNLRVNSGSESEDEVFGPENQDFAPAAEADIVDIVAVPQIALQVAPPVAPPIAPLVNLQGQPPVKKMADVEAINTRVKNFIPEFNGYGSSDVKNDLNKFKQATRWTFDNTVGNDEAVFHQLLKFRLTGDAFERISNRNIITVNNLLEVLTDIYCETRSIDKIFANCFNCSQKQAETVKQFGTRLHENLGEYKAAYEVKYEQPPNGTHHRALENMAIKTFKQGISDPMIRKQLLIEDMETLAENIDRADLIEEMLSGENQNVTTPQVPSNIDLAANVVCSFCSTKGHTWDICQIRKNTPACSLCNEYGHLVKDCPERKNTPHPPKFSNAINKNFVPQPQRNFNSSGNLVGQNRFRNNGPHDNQVHRNHNSNQTNRNPRNFSGRNFTEYRSNNRPNTRDNQNFNLNFGQNRNFIPPNLNRQLAILPPPNNVPNRYGNGRHCDYCNKPGHVRDDCFKARDDNRRNQKPGNMGQLEHAMGRMDINHIHHLPHSFDQHHDEQFVNRSENFNGSDMLNEDNGVLIQY